SRCPRLTADDAYLSEISGGHRWITLEIPPWENTGRRRQQLLLRFMRCRRGQRGRRGTGVLEGKLAEVRGQDEKSATDTLITQDSMPSRPLTDRDELHGFTAQMTHDCGDLEGKTRLKGLGRKPKTQDSVFVVSRSARGSSISETPVRWQPYPSSHHARQTTEHTLTQPTLPHLHLTTFIKFSKAQGDILMRRKWDFSLFAVTWNQWLER
ncbi:unnamed protein product, partial [Pleuronectes platessa]